MEKEINIGKTILWGQLVKNENSKEIDIEYIESVVKEMVCCDPPIPYIVETDSMNYYCNGGYEEYGN